MNTNSFTKVSIITFISICFSYSSAFSQLVTNNGTNTTINQGCLVVVKNASVNNSTGSIDNAGDFYIDQNIINSGSMSGGNAAGNFFIGGDWINNGLFTANQSKVELTGGNQQITGTNSTSFYNLKLIGTGIKSQTLNATVTNTLDLGSLELATNTNKMFVTNPATNAILLTSGYVSSLGNGRLSRVMNSQSSYLYPVGSSLGTLRYRPIEITPTVSGSHTFEVRMANVDATTEAYDRSIKDTTICDVNPSYYHLIGRTQGTGVMNLNFFYQPAIDGTYPICSHWQNLPQWEDMGAVTNSTNGIFTTQARNWNNFTLEAFALAKPAPTLTITGLSPSYCSNAAPVNLFGSPLGGSFSGNGVSNGQFSPALAGAGTHPISYTYFDPISQCSQTKTQSVVVNPIPQVSIAASGPLNFCEGQSVTLTGNGASTYIWSNAATGSSLNVVAAGTYTVAGTSPEGCTSTSASTTVSVLTAPVPAILSSTGTNTICTGTSAILSGPTASIYSWTGNQSTSSISVTTPGTYDLTVTYANGCQASNSFLVGPGTPPSPQIVADGPLTFCASENVILTTTTPYVSYQWNGYNSTLAFANIINSGTYSVTVVAANGCTGTSNAITVGVLPLPNPTVTPVGTVNICAGDNTTVATQTGFASYQWSPSGGTSNTASVNQSGYYYATVTDNNGCTNTSDSVHVIVNSLPNPITIAANGPTNFCEGNSVVLTAPAGFQSYTWSQGSQTQNIVVTSSGTYTCAVTNQFGCSPATTSNPVTVNVFTGTPPTASYSGDTLISTAANSYQWYFNGQIILGATNSTYNAQKSGEYYVVITDANGCVIQSNTLEFTYVGINDQISGLEYLNVFPNPTEDFVTVELKFIEKSNFILELTDMLGNELIMPDLIKNKSTFTKNYSLTELSVGVYFLKVSVDGESTVHKIIKK